MATQRRELKDQIDQINRDPRRGDGHSKPMSTIRVDRVCIAALGKQGFRLESVHAPGDIRAETGFDFDAPAEVPVTKSPSKEELQALRGPVAKLVASVTSAATKQPNGIGSSRPYRASATTERRRNVGAACMASSSMPEKDSVWRCAAWGRDRTRCPPEPDGGLD